MRKYLRDGSEVEVIQTLQLDGKEQYIVGHILLDEEGEEVDIGNPVIVDRVFDSLLRNKYSQESEIEKKRLDRYRDEANVLGAQIVALRKEQWELETQRKALITKLSQVDALKDIEAILEGKFTHYILPQDYSGIPTIISAEVVHRGAYSVPARHVLSLFGDIKGGFEWRKSSEFSGHGEFKKCIPCKSLEEAKQKEAEIILGLLKESGTHRLRDYISAADKAGVVIPTKYRDALRAEEKRRLCSRLEEARKSLRDVLDDFKSAGVPAPEDQPQNEEERPF